MKSAKTVGGIGQNHNMPANSVRHNVMIPFHKISSLKLFPRVYVQILCRKKRNVNNAKSPSVGKRDNRNEKMVFVTKKYETSDITNVTMRALLNNGIVRIVPTTKIFSDNKTEYIPIAKSVVR